jgi:hypothetical protein
MGIMWGGRTVGVKRVLNPVRIPRRMRRRTIRVETLVDRVAVLRPVLPEVLARVARTLRLGVRTLPHEVLAGVPRTLRTRRPVLPIPVTRIPHEILTRIPRRLRI